MCRWALKGPGTLRAVMLLLVLAANAPAWLLGSRWFVHRSVSRAGSPSSVPVGSPRPARAGAGAGGVAPSSALPSLLLSPLCVPTEGS